MSDDIPSGENQETLEAKVVSQSWVAHPYGDYDNRGGDKNGTLMPLGVASDSAEVAKYEIGME